MIQIGDEVQYKGEWYGVADVSYMQGNQITSAQVGGTFHVQLDMEDDGYVWVDANDVLTYDNFEGKAPSPENPALNQSITGWLDGLELRKDNMKLYEVMTLLSAIQYDKEGCYGSSWKGKGEYRGIMANIDRKYDRLDKITADEINGKRKPLPSAEYEELTPTDMNNIGESKIDAVADLAVYSLLYLTYLKEAYPGAFRVWVVKNIPQYLRDRIPYI